MTATTLTQSGLRRYVIQCLNPQCALPSQLDDTPAIMDRDTFRRKGQFEEIDGVKYRRETDAVNVTESRRKPTSKILYSPMYLERETITCISILSAAQRCWVNYCYIDKGFNEDELTTCVNDLMPLVLERLFIVTAGRGKITAAAQAKIRNVFLLAAGEARYRLNHNGRIYHTPKQVQMIIEATPRSWRGTWSKRWHALVAIWLEHDSGTLLRLEGMLDAIEALNDSHD